MKEKTILYCGLLFLFSCNSGNDKSGDGIIGVKTILWTQYSAEVEALFFQGYNIASDIVSGYDHVEDARPPAVTLDLDETVSARSTTV